MLPGNVFKIYFIELKKVMNTVFKLSAFAFTNLYQLLKPNI